MKTRIPYFLIVLVVSLFIVAGSTFGQNGGFVLDKKTIQAYKVVVYDNNSAVQQYAAGELRNYIRKIFQHDMKQVPKSKIVKNGRYFFIGYGFISDSLNLQKQRKKDAITKVFFNRNIYLGGLDDLTGMQVKDAFFTLKDQARFGSLYALYSFLEDDLGVHWFFPTDLGEFIPSPDKYLLTEGTYFSAPAFTERAFGIKFLYYDLDTAMIWLLRNRAGLSNMKLYNHSWNKLIPTVESAKGSESIYAEVDGKRTASKEAKHAQFCTTNNFLIELFVRQSLDYLKKNPSQPYLSLSPNDNKHFCECASCRELDVATRINPTYSRMSNRIFTFYRQVADSVWKYYPQAKIGGYAYKSYAVATQKNLLPDDFHIRLAINNFGFGNRKCSSKATLFKIIRTWKYKENKGFYCFPYGNTWVYPYLRTSLYRELISELQKNGFKKVKFTFFPDWYTQGLDIWLITKMLWSPDVNVDSLKQIYYRSVYPNSYSIIRDFHDALMEKTSEPETCIPSFSAAGKERTRLLLDELFPKYLLSGTQKRITVFLAKHSPGEKEKTNLTNFLSMMKFLELEKEGNSSDSWGGLFREKETKEQALKQIKAIRYSLILSTNSKYWNPKKSPSSYINK